MERHPHAIRGVTLVELMLTISIGAILAMLAAPALGGLLARVRAASAEAAVANSLRQARNAAVMRGTRVLVCPSRDGLRCRSGDDWQHGWIIAPDVDRDGQPDSASRILTRVDAMPHGTRLVTSAGRGHIIFHSNGNAAGSNVTFTICHPRARGGKSVVVANSGRVRVGAPTPDRLRACLAGLQ